MLQQLNAAFPMELHGNMFFTIWYGVFRHTRTLAYAGGGHPPPFLVSGTESTKQIRQLECPGPPVGVVPEDPFSTLRVPVPPASTLLIYSDGAIEVWEKPGHL